MNGTFRRAAPPAPVRPGGLLARVAAGVGMSAPNFTALVVAFVVVMVSLLQLSSTPGAAGALGLRLHHNVSARQLPRGHRSAAPMTADDRNLK